MEIENISTITNKKTFTDCLPIICLSLTLFGITAFFSPYLYSLVQSGTSANQIRGLIDISDKLTPFLFSLSFILLLFYSTIKRCYLITLIAIIGILDNLVSRFFFLPGISLLLIFLNPLIFLLGIYFSIRKSNYLIANFILSFSYSVFFVYAVLNLNIF